MDPVLESLTPGPTIPLADAVTAGRRAVLGAAAALLAVPDAALERPWPWRGEEADVRYGLYRPLERLEAIEADARRALAARGDVPTPAAALIAPATVARWDLHGLLVGLEPGLLDADPGGDEWTIRQTLGHMVSGQRGYGWFTGWWLGQVGREPFPSAVPDELADRLPDEHGPEMAGTPEELRARLDGTLDDATARLAGLGHEELAARARWSGIEVDVGFRLGRWSSHLQEHTIQVEKTLLALGRSPSEVERVVRRILVAYGRLEATVFGRPADVLEARDDRGRSVAGMLATIASIEASAVTVREAAVA